jgi:acetyltransferase-like isoleucine patch superfamily enzyme
LKAALTGKLSVVPLYQKTTMKDFIKILFSFLSRLKAFLLLFSSGGKANGAAVPACFYRSSFSLKGTGNKLLQSGRTEKSQYFIDGSGNTVTLVNTEVLNSIITVSGNNNTVVCEDGVKLRNAIVTIRGNSCTIKIGRGTTFGGVRIINVGADNNINIGEGCLFADFIEIWGSDSHPIYNEGKEIINTEKPIVIKDRVWVGARAIILKGVTIESGSVVGMGSLVINDVPPSSITVGNPNRIIKDNVHWALHY